MNPIVTVILLALILVAIISPLAALAPLMLIAAFSVLAWMGWTIIRAFFTGETEDI
ncbi:hypothetical protein [Leptolyngbya ohadii]|uniref:hypothetical protein n=1 Tax=Leptolyngbya ohadii TaxID=1962290 RepID=UPI0015C671DD|nr:hypothetical protein [Leptolyngbya ohadii]